MSLRAGGGRAPRLVRAAARAAARTLWRHPDELVRFARGALMGRVGVPLDALRWLLSATAVEGSGPREVVLTAVPPGVKVEATLEVLGNEVRAVAVVCVESVELFPDAWRVTLRVADAQLTLLRGAPDSPVAALLRSGALDLRRPGELAAYMPSRPDFLVAASEDRLVLDLLKWLAPPGPLRARLLPLLTALVEVQGVETDWERLELCLRPLPRGWIPGLARGIGTTGSRPR